MLKLKLYFIENIHWSGITNKQQQQQNNSENNDYLFIMAHYDLLKSQLLQG